MGQEECPLNWKYIQEDKRKKKITVKQKIYNILLNLFGDFRGNLRVSGKR